MSGVGINSMRTKSVMPGGGIARRPLHVILLADCSGSMTGAKIQALNFAIGDMLQHFASWEREQEKQILIRAIAFATEPRWHIHEPLPATHMRWKALSVVPGGRTNMAPVFRMVAQTLTTDQASRGLRPVLVLITDGLPTDEQADFDAGLEALLSVPAGRDAMRIAVAIGSMAQSEALTKFVGNSSLPVLVAGDVEQIADQLHRASLWVTNPNIRSANLLGGEADPSGPVIQDIDDVVV
ncbi:MAG TPA: vWA domain-containing protein [Streptosporangiaceae bacterium]|nr:vWA domain-containing protein [Streptosporangiaceae bacterium]